MLKVKRAQHWFSYTVKGIVLLCCTDVLLWRQLIMLFGSKVGRDTRCAERNSELHSVFTIADERHEHIFLVCRICINSSSSSFSSSLVTAAHSEFTLWFTPWKLPSEKGAFRNSTVQENHICVSLTCIVLESTIPTTFALWLKRISS